MYKTNKALDTINVDIEFPVSQCIDNITDNTYKKKLK